MSRSYTYNVTTCTIKKTFAESSSLAGVHVWNVLHKKSNSRAGGPHNYDATNEIMSQATQMELTLAQTCLFELHAT